MRRRGEFLADGGTGEKGDVGTGGNRDAFVFVARDRECRIGEGEDHSTVGDVEAVEHVLANRHRDDGMTGLGHANDHAERGRRAVACEHYASALGLHCHVSYHILTERSVSNDWSRR